MPPRYLLGNRIGYAARPSSRRQAGWAMVEVTLALVLATLLAIWQVGTEIAQARDAQAQAAGHWLSQVRLAVDQMLRAHHDALVAGRSPLGAAGQSLFDLPLAPRLDELRRAGHLPPDYASISPLGFTAAVSITVAAACPGAGCRLDAVVAAVLPSGVSAWLGSSDERAVISQTLGGYALQVRAAHPMQWRGSLLALPATRQDASARWPVGSLSAWAGADHASMLAYLRVGDTRDPDFKGRLTVAGPITTQALAATGDVRAGGHLQAGGDLSTGGSVHAATHIHAAGQLSSDGHVYAGGWVRPNLVAPLGGGCSVPGAIARDASGESLSCMRGQWRPGDGAFGGAFSRVAGEPCTWTGNPRTGTCACPPGFQAIKVYGNHHNWHWEQQTERTAWVCAR